MGELHLDIIVDRMRREFSVEANIGKPQVAYRECIRNTVKLKASLFVSQADVVNTVTYGLSLSLRKMKPPMLSSFDNAIVGGVVPKEYIPAIQKGVEEQIKNGVLAGYPLLGLKATLYDGSFHDVDSNEMAFKIAASHGHQTAIRSGRCCAFRAHYVGRSCNA